MDGIKSRDLPISVTYNFVKRGGRKAQRPILLFKKGYVLILRPAILYLF